jgi:hypothetical protein
LLVFLSETMILCITHSQDTYTIELVQQRLQQLGYPSFRFNSDEFGTRYRLRYRLTPEGPQYQLQHGKQTLNASDLLPWTLPMFLPSSKNTILPFIFSSMHWMCHGSIPCT